MKTVGSFMFTASITLEDRLVNWLVGIVMDFKVINNKVKITFVKFDDKATWIIAM